MKKFFSTLLVFGLLFGSSAVFSAESKGVAVVDVQQVVMNSAKVKKLEQDRNKQEQTLKNQLLNAKKVIEAEQNAEKKKALQDKYNKEISATLNAQNKVVAERTQAIEKEMMAFIQKKAIELGYDIVLVKGSVLYGGTDITNEIIKMVK